MGMSFSIATIFIQLKRNSNLILMLVQKLWATGCHYKAIILSFVFLRLLTYASFVPYTDF